MLRAAILASLLTAISAQKLMKVSHEPSRLVWVTCKLSCPSLRSVCTLDCEATQNGRIRQSFKISGKAEQLKDQVWLQNTIQSSDVPLLQTYGKQVLEIFLEIIPGIIPAKLSRSGKTRLRYKE